MKDLNLHKTPYIDALKKYLEKDPVPFDVPGHHMGNVTNDATLLLGKEIFKFDVNAPRGLDNLAYPTGVLKESEDITARICGADDAFFLINGTSSGILAMILATIHAGEKIILPRNVHKSIINALIISGGLPVYVMPEMDNNLEIVNQPSLASWKKAILANPSAKAIFIINPTYFGSVGDLESLVQFAHQHKMLVLVDEAHGAHYYFNSPFFPKSAMACGADLSSVSFHKTLGSLTQSSILLSKGERVSKYAIQKALNIVNSTSPSGLLFVSLEGARKYLYEHMYRGLDEMHELIQYTIDEINKINGFSCPSTKYFIDRGSFGYDESKVIISIEKLRLDGFSLYNLLADEYNIQLELAEPHLALMIFTFATKKEHVERLIKALKDVSRRFYDTSLDLHDQKYDINFPYMLVRPRTAFHAPGVKVGADELIGKISKEQVMIYPPGIPLISPGEVWSKKLVERIIKYKDLGVKFMSTYPDGFEVIDASKWKRYPVYEKRYLDYMETSLTTALEDGYYFPFEGDKHSATIILLPFRADTWRNNGKEARRVFKNVILAISKFEKVIVGIHPYIYEKVAPEYLGLPNVEVIKIRYNDSWARDNMPLFVTNGKKLRGVDFRFNAWGGEVDGLYSNWDDDDKISSIFLKRYKIQAYTHPKFIFEGGSIACDGDGTAIVTEACLLSKGRNPCLTKEEIEETIKHYLGINKVIWISRGIYNDETNEHVDNMVSFVKPGEIVLAWSDNLDDVQHEISAKVLKELQEAVDYRGRKFIIHKLNVPFHPLYEQKEEAAGIRKSTSNAKGRYEGDRLAASYVNYYQGKDFVIMPGFGIEDDKLAYEQMKKIYPNKEVIQINTREVLLGGGNIHCITMQIPSVEEE